MLTSYRFFVATMVIYFFNTAWLALSGLYPMAFDEQFHVGLIKLYSTRLTPFWTSQPPGEAVYGAVARDPSYLYHYLVSFPYRFLDNFVQSEAYQIIILRFVSLALVGLGIWVFRKVLLGAGFSKAVTHVSLMILVLTPMTPFFGAQVNYDPVVFLMVAVCVRLAQQVLQTFRSTQKIDVTKLFLLAMAGMFGSLVKYAFLPVILAIGLFLLWQMYKSQKPVKQIWQQSRKSFARLSTGIKVALIGGFIILFGLCLERYGVNTVKYRTPTPECDQVLSIDECMPYSPWRRNYLTTKSYQEGRLKTRFSPETRQFPRYSVTIWLSKMTDQLFFTIDGAASNYKIGKPFRAPRIASVTIMVTGLALFIWYYRRLSKRFGINLLLLVSGLYMSALLAQNYLDYLHIGYPYAIQGRYLMPILPLAYAVFAQVFSTSLGQRLKTKMVLSGLVIILFATQAGGAGTYILRSNPSWWWPSQTVIRANQTAQKVLRPFVIGD